jgi:2-methylcitrate dehydratase PrpD
MEQERQMSPPEAAAASLNTAGAPATWLLRTLARRLARPVAPEDRARAALHVLDWAGCAVAGAASPAGRGLRAGLALYGGGAALVAAAVGGAAPAGAAFVNGGVGNVLEMDDIHRTSILHPGPVVIPAALAAGEALGGGGRWGEGGGRRGLLLLFLLQLRESRSRRQWRRRR